MKDIKVVCPRCESDKVRMPIIEGAHIFTEENTDPRDAVSDKVVRSTDNITYICVCDKCKHTFYVGVVVECTPKSFIVKDELKDIFTAKKSELVKL